VADNRTTDDSVTFKRIKSWVKGSEKLKIAGGTVAAEITAVGVSQATILAMSDQFGWLRRKVAEYVIKPDFDHISWVLDKFPAIEGRKGAVKRKAGTTDEQAYDIADGAVNFAGSFITGYYTNIYGQRLMDHLMDVEQPNKRNYDKARWLFNYPAQWGSMILMQMVVPDVTIKISDKLGQLYQKQLGIEEDKAGEMARIAVNVQVPNIVGAVANWLALCAMRGKGGR
jgi:hypothetical protein